MKSVFRIVFPQLFLNRFLGWPTSETPSDSVAGPFSVCWDLQCFIYTHCFGWNLHQSHVDLFIIICHFEGARFKRLYRLVNQVSVWLVSVFRVLCCFQDSCHVCKMEVELKLIFWVPIRFWLIFVWKSFIITQLSIEWAETRDSLIYIVAWERQFPKGNNLSSPKGAVGSILF